MKMLQRICILVSPSLEPISNLGTLNDGHPDCRLLLLKFWIYSTWRLYNLTMLQAQMKIHIHKGFALFWIESLVSRSTRILCLRTSLPLSLNHLLNKLCAFTSINWLWGNLQEQDAGRWPHTQTARTSLERLTVSYNVYADHACMTLFFTKTLSRPHPIPSSLDMPLRT